MANPSNGIDQGTYEENHSLLPASGLGALPADPTLGDVGATGSDAVLGNGIPTANQTNGLAVSNPLLLEQLRQFIMDTVDSAVRRSQTSGMGPSSQAERGGTQASHGTAEPTHGIQQDIPSQSSESKKQGDKLPRTPCNLWKGR
ncbi:UNVERIFIED_CONTAM: hypothetical protein Slati_3525500 [Sesamum latifolium]|uniref:Uncharacterized protein n=1 Tax=Sesamum latifolium TaxID=2727402 RepID=A0AAW2UNG9_9LAMI